MKKAIIRIILQLCLVGGVFFIVVFLIGYNDKRNHCSDEELFKSKYIKGRITIHKFDTPNHGYPFICVNPDIGKLYFELEENGVFDSLLLGDSIFKGLGSDTIWVIQENGNVPFVVDFGC